ncbi:hypothetical protein Taro_009615 [Colocasia esculenta]|uniref:Uncharacterized protein n=1 Tax=Colocasia esculenta TaxID=4460 RepID=A0A843U5D7_COLES|nr:hypothetical protein [Colocasia esculenta]
MLLLTWLLGVSRGDTWLFLPDLVEVRDVGACILRLWSLVVAPVFRELLCLSKCVLRVCFRMSLTLLVLRVVLLPLVGVLVALVGTDSLSQGVRCQTVVVAVCCTVRCQQC